MQTLQNHRTEYHIDLLVNMPEPTNEPFPRLTITQFREHNVFGLPFIPQHGGNPTFKDENIFDHDGIPGTEGNDGDLLSPLETPKLPLSQPAHKRQSLYQEVYTKMILWRSLPTSLNRFFEDDKPDLDKKFSKIKSAKRWRGVPNFVFGPPRKLLRKVWFVTQTFRISSNSDSANGMFKEDEYLTKSEQVQQKIKFAILIIITVFTTFRILHSYHSQQFESAQSTLLASTSDDRSQLLDPFVPAKSSYSRRAEAIARAAVKPRHMINSNGRLEVDSSLPMSAHPIYQLIADANTKWQLKVESQSKTLKEAVAEYKRRNRNLNPPKGFDQWWKFVVENNVQLPDEYDQINTDLMIFRALSPSDLSKRITKASRIPDTFQITISNGEIYNKTTLARPGVGFEGVAERVAAQLELITDFGIQKWLPDMRVVYGLHDTPQGFISYDHKRDLVERYEDGEYYDPSDEVDISIRGWAAGCPPGSPARHYNRYVTSPKKKIFIANHAVQFDLCNNPHLFSEHGVTSGRLPRVDGELKAIFSLSKTTLHSDVLAVPIEQWHDSLPVVPWGERKSNKLIWRGANTGIFHSRKTHWRNTHRTRLVKMTGKAGQGQLEILPAPLTPGYDTLESGMIKGDAGSINKQLFDVAFVGVPIQCARDGTCEDLKAEYDFKAIHMTHYESLRYKYVLDLDGNAWSARTKRLLAGEQLLFKATIFPEWWTQRIAPWVHYIPIQIDYSDLHDALVFFRGDGKGGEGGEDALAAQIARAGRVWGETHWRRVDMAAYTARLYLEWARLLPSDRGSMDFVYHPSMELTRM